MMKKFLWIIVLLPLISVAQTKAKAKKKVAKTQVVKAKQPVKLLDGFLIKGTVTDCANGTKISLLNGQTGAPESESTITNNSFTFQGKVDKPSFKILLIDQKPPYLTLFIDNSEITVNGTKDKFDQSTVSGSPSHNDFYELNAALTPYQNYFGENAQSDEAGVQKASQALENFINAKKSSYISPLAIVRFTQINDDMSKAEKLFNSLDANVRTTEIGNYVANQIAEAKLSGVGSTLEDFAQADTTGKPISLSSFKGKYVLVDFWASWCRPCRQENPNVVASYNKYKDKNFIVFGVSLDKSKPAWIEAIKMDGLTWPHVSDLKGWGNEVALKLKITSIPQNFLIGPDGKIIAKNLRGPALDRKLEKLLK